MSLTAFLSAWALVDISPHAKLVLMAIAARKDPDSEIVEVPPQNVMLDTGLTYDQLEEAFGELLKRGLVAKASGRLGFVSVKLSIGGGQ